MEARKLVLTAAGREFIISNTLELTRAGSLETAEPKTIEWLDSMGDGDVLFDVGANIGCFTIYAATRGHEVVAFEPHLINAAHLLTNLDLNHVMDKVQIVNTPLHGTCGWTDFHYASIYAGTARHQNGVGIERWAKNALKLNATPYTELKYSTTLDAMHYQLPTPTHIKIDVDGNELEVLWGAPWFLREAREVLVEVRDATRGLVRDLLMQAGYTYSAEKTWQFRQGDQSNDVFIR